MRVSRECVALPLWQVAGCLCVASHWPTSAQNLDCVTKFRAPDSTRYTTSTDPLIRCSTTPWRRIFEKWSFEKWHFIFCYFSINVCRSFGRFRVTWKVGLAMFSCRRTSGGPQPEWKPDLYTAPTFSTQTTHSDPVAARTGARRFCAFVSFDLILAPS